MSVPIIYITDAQNDMSLFSLHDICERCGMRAEIVVEMVEYGIVTPLAVQDTDRWQFNTHALMQLNRAQRLRHDLKLNLPGLALSMELLDEIDLLKKKVSSLQFQLRQPHDGWAWHTYSV